MNAGAQDRDAPPPGGPPPPAAPVPPAYGTPAGYGPPPGYGAPPGYGPPPGYGLPPAYGAYGAPHGYGTPSWAAAPWPHGPGRPAVATAAATLGFVTGGLTAVVTLGVLLSVVRGDDDPSTVLMLLGLPCAAAVITGAARLVGRRSAFLLFRGAVASVAVLVLVAVVGLATLYGDALVGMLVVVVLALPLPILTAVFAAQPRVRGWVAGG
jgi:hypothetical protein